MSWCCGSQLTATSPPLKADALAMTLAWVTTTPLGSLVEPDVYCRKSTRPGVSAIGAPPKSRVASVATQGNSGSRSTSGQGSAPCRLPTSRRKSYSSCLVDSTALA